MMAPYLLRLLCLCLAAFFVIHSVTGLVVAASGPAAGRAARGMRPRSAGGFLLALRLLPAALALFVVAGLCVPSYLWLEPETNAEEVGAGCLAAAILAAALWTLSTARGVRAAARSSRRPSPPAPAKVRSSLLSVFSFCFASAGLDCGCPGALAGTGGRLRFAAGAALGGRARRVGLGPGRGAPLEGTR